MKFNGMFNFKTIFPSVADNDYQGSKVALYFFILFTAVMTWRSIIHMYFVDYGLHGIANFIHFDGNPDPSKLIHFFFSIWGFAELIFCIVCWTAIIKYRSLVPSLYILWLTEWSVRNFYYPQVMGITEMSAYKTGVTPGAVGAPYLFVALLIFFLLSIRASK